MIPVATAAEMRALDEATIRDVGLPGAVLMETAGRGVAAVVMRVLGEGSRLGRVAVICGAGNNGGDGFVIARVLRAAGHDATAYLLAARDRVRGDAALHLGAYERSGGRVVEITAAEQLDDVVAPPSIAGAARASGAAAVIVDAIFGTGLDREVTGLAAAVIERINASPAIRIAVDIPSGLSADTGHPLGTAIRAHHTVTMGLPKVGAVGAPGVAWAGELHVVDIGIPRAMAEAGTRAALIERDDARAWLPSRGVLDHKNRRGHVLVVGGSPGKRGAGRLAATAALRGGAGLCTLAGPAGPDFIAPDAVMTAAVDDAAALQAALAGKQALVVGPGMPDDEVGRAWVDAALAAGIPTVLDATALTHLAGRLDVVAAAASPAILTPHPGEAGRLLDVPTAAVEADRMHAVRTLAARTRAVVVLKGARTLVCGGGDLVTINPTGGPALGTAGSGDVLAGLLGALLAQGLAPLTAARLGVYLHGLAGDLLASRLGTGTVASDLPTILAEATLALAR